MKKMKVLAVATMVSLGALSMVACKKGEPEVKIERDVQGSGIGEYKGDKEVISGEKMNKENDSKDTASKQVPDEYKKVTVNENGVKIYGKIVGSSNGGANASASPEAIKVIEKNVRNDKDIAKEGLSVTYSEYYSKSYGGTVIIRTGNKTGSLSIYNEKGDKFIVGEKPDNDLEVILANYRMGNAMAEAMDKVNKRK